MTVWSTNTPTPRLRDFLSSLAPKNIRFDPWGLATGFRAYRIFTQLNGLSDSELAALGIARADVPRVAMDTATNSRAA